MIAEEYFRSADAKSYEKQFGGLDAADVRHIRFHLKEIFKPTISAQKAFDPMKPGQGISAWSRNTQMMFGLAARILNYQLLKSLKSHVIYDNRLTPRDMQLGLRREYNKISDVALNGVTDFEMFDSQQDSFSQLLERRFLSRLGCSDTFLEHYYSYRRGGKLIADGISGSLTTEKPSGEPLTLLGNSIISLALMNYLLRGDGPVVMAVKGDDGFKRQLNLKIVQERVDRLQSFCRLRIKAAIEPTAEFCGFAIGSRSFSPAIPRKFVKLMGHEFRDFNHFGEYRKSLIDWLKEFDEQGYGDVMATNSKLFSVPVCELEAMMEVMKSVIHLGSDQFYATVFMAKQDEFIGVPDEHGDFGVKPLN